MKDKKVEIITKTKPNLISDEIDDDMKKRVKDMDEIIEEYKKPAKTNILKKIKFENAQDEYVFNSLPLSDKQKEELLIAFVLFLS